MSAPNCWHPTADTVTADTVWCDDCGEPLPTQED